MLGQCGGKGSLVHCWWECKTVAGAMEESVEVPQKTKKKELPNDSAVPILSIYPKKTKH